MLGTLRRFSVIRGSSAPGPSALGLRLARDVRGATIIEFAAVAAPLAALLIAILQTSLTFFTQQALESVSEVTARQIITGAVQMAGTNQADFKKLACTNLPKFMTCDNLMLDVQTAASLDKANTKAPAITYDKNGKISNTWSFDLGSAGSIVVMKAMYTSSVISGPLGFDLSNMGSGRRLLIATAVFKTEPYVLNTEPKK